MKYCWIRGKDITFSSHDVENICTPCATKFFIGVEETPENILGVRRALHLAQGEYLTDGNQYENKLLEENSQ